MSEQNIQNEEPRKRRIPRKLIVIILLILAFAVGMAIEVYKHSDGRMKSLLEDNKKSFEACAEFFGNGEGSAAVSSDVSDSSTADPSQKRAVYTSAQFLADKYKDYPISEDITKLSDAGIQKIALSGYEVRFYTDIDSGVCYISEQAQKSPGFYYPEGYLDDNRIDGDWYRFGKDVKKK